MELKKFTHKSATPIILILLLWGLLPRLAAQQNTEVEKIVFDNQFRFAVSPVLYDDLKLTYNGDKLLKSHFSFSGEIAISYYRHIAKGFGIIIGAGLGVAPFNIHYYFKAPENSIFQTTGNTGDNEYLDLVMYDYFNWMWVFPVSVQKVFLLNENTLFNIEAGLKLNIQGNFPWEAGVGSSYYIDEQNPDVQLFEFYLYDTGNKSLAGYFIKAGIIKINKKQNTFHLNLVFNYSPQKIGEGWYKFHNLTFENYGTVEQNINYIGLEFVYGITFPKIKAY